MKSAPPAWLLERAQQLLEDDLRAGRTGRSRASRRRHLLEVAALLLMHVAQEPRRKTADPLRIMAQRIAADLLAVEREWAEGLVPTLDDALGWKRPKGWKFYPDAARRRQERLRPAIWAVIEQRRQGVGVVAALNAVSKQHAVSYSDLSRACYSDPGFRAFSGLGRTKRKTAAAP